MEHISIENICDGNRMGAARDILAHPGIALAAVGSPACVRSLYLIAKEINRTDFLFWRSLSERDYSLGRNGQAIQACIQEAAAYPEVKGVIVYASCMDILTGWDVERAIAQAENPRKIPVEVLYRGPLAKRRRPPLEKLQEIWEKWQIDKSGPSAQIQCREKLEPPKEPHFAETIRKYANSDCDILLLTPGGCKSCLRLESSFDQKTSGEIKNTRLTDISLSGLTAEKLTESILAAFPEDRPLLLLESMAVKMVGLDLQRLERLLTAEGKTVWR